MPNKCASKLIFPNSIPLPKRFFIIFLPTQWIIAPCGGLPVHARSLPVARRFCNFPSLSPLIDVAEADLRAYVLRSFDEGRRRREGSKWKATRRERRGEKIRGGEKEEEEEKTRDNR